MILMGRCGCCSRDRGRRCCGIGLGTEHKCLGLAAGTFVGGRVACRASARHAGVRGVVHVHGAAPSGVRCDGLGARLLFGLAAGTFVGGRVACRASARHAGVRGVALELKLPFAIQT